LKEQYYFKDGNTSIFSYDLDKITRGRFDESVEFVQATYTQWLKDTEEVHEHNKVITQHNDLQEEKIKQIMNTLGVREKYSEFVYKTSRSRNKTEVKKTAGFLDDINRVKPKDSFDRLKRDVDLKVKSIINFGETKLKEADQKRREQELQEKQQKDIQTLAFLKAKYTNYSDSDIHDVLEQILNKNKYLRLAYWLEQNRIDWTDGYSNAETGFSTFNVENETDENIHSCISDLIESEDIDGRVFRDCEWNYTKLYDMVEDEELLNDLELAKELEEEW